ncbi:lipid II:glycine glycyltransferase FemX [Psychroserpens ponticola]|uniref:Peptidoglycan bridge formation glycyltransferase FemA/FemB family protein n=1 Tax=Psychroserpens ponticola TaxID=2932268 RepID=A0ABY7RZI1_9FLAO|nr:peptidoglycan bridge formation glycyltransferase FemA/FemB family protein [Psychroserpens ponticola]WCO02545.1 peptidoglycan bridge formation glycyltransferase FemA/FemB family protein [Psychroserpens ponticola]
MKELIFTKDSAWLKKWDEFLVNNPKGSHLILSDWLKSYKSYGFDFELGLVLENDKIVGGYGAVIPKFMFFKFYIIPHGLVYDSDYEHLFETHVPEIKNRAKQKGCCYMQISVPLSSNKMIHANTYRPQDVSFLEPILKKGKLFNYVYSGYGLNWVELQGFNEEELLNTLKSNTRRDIRAGLRKHDAFRLLTTESDIKRAYQLCQQNADEHGYALRSWTDFKTTVLDLIEKGIAHFIGVFKDEDQKGAVFIVQSGGFYTYIFGGTKREHPNLLSGYVLQWEALKMSINKNFNGYNISMGGSRGVLNFKSKFSTTAIPYENPHYHSVLNGFYFKLFLFLDKYLEPYKAKISKVLSKLSR